MRERSAGDYEEIRQLAYRYAEAVDSRDLAALVALFVEDVRVGRQAQGREALAAWFDPVLRTFGVSIHFVGNHRTVTGGNGAASGDTYCFAHHLTSGTDLVMAVHYHDKYVRQDGRWRFATRDVDVLWTETRAVA